MWDAAWVEIGLTETMTPTEVTILGGSSDGETAILEAEGRIDGKSVSFEVTLIKMGDFWVATEVSM